jgi:hypothetical protein
LPNFETSALNASQALWCLGGHIRQVNAVVVARLVSVPTERTPTWIAP